MSALPLKADIAGRQLDVRFVPEADILRRGKRCGAGPFSPKETSPDLKRGQGFGWERFY